MTRVLLHTNDPDTALEIVRRHHPDLSPAICTDYAGLAEAVATSAPEVVYSCRFAPGAFPRAGLMEAPGVRWVSNAGSGVNHLMPWDPATVTVTNSAGVAAAAMAQYAIAMMLHFSLDVPGLIADQTARVWRTRSVTPLVGRTLVIVGLGKTGCEAARLASAMGMTVLGVRARPQPTAHVDEVVATGDLPRALARADHVLVAVPLLDSTRGLLGAAAFDAIKPGAVLVDVSRGGVVIPGALLAALDTGRVRGAALDVFETEPLPPGDPLWSRPEVIVSPHCSGVWPGWEAASVEMFAANLTRWRRGAPLQNVVDPARGY